jgi:hypothetical protein
MALFGSEVMSELGPEDDGICCKRRSHCADGLLGEFRSRAIWGSILILMLGKLPVLVEDDRGAWRAALGSVP